MPKRVKPRPEFATQVAVARILAEFKYPDLNTIAKPRTNTPGGAMTIQVACYDATPFSASKADFMLMGTIADGFALQTYINELSLLGGTCHLSEGTVSSDHNIMVPAGVKLLGRGSSTVINAAVAGWAVTGLEGSVLEDFDVINTVGSGARLGIAC